MTSKRLLIVDDEPEFGQFVRKVAEEMDLEVKVTTQPRHFKEVYGAFDPTVILLDVVMPGTDGIELVNWLADRHYQGKLVIVTGFTPRYAEMASALSLGKGMTSVTTLYKPVDLAKLRAALA